MKEDFVTVEQKKDIRDIVADENVVGVRGTSTEIAVNSRGDIRITVTVPRESVINMIENNDLILPDAEQDGMFGVSTHIAGRKRLGENMRSKAVLGLTCDAAELLNRKDRPHFTVSILSEDSTMTYVDAGPWLSLTTDRALMDLARDGWVQQYEYYPAHREDFFSWMLDRPGIEPDLDQVIIDAMSGGGPVKIDFNEEEDTPLEMVVQWLAENRTELFLMMLDEGLIPDNCLSASDGQLCRRLSAEPDLMRRFTDILFGDRGGGIASGMPECAGRVMTMRAADGVDDDKGGYPEI